MRNRFPFACDMNHFTFYHVFFLFFILFGSVVYSIAIRFICVTTLEYAVVSIPFHIDCMAHNRISPKIEKFILLKKQFNRKRKFSSPIEPHVPAVILSIRLHARVPFHFHFALLFFSVISFCTNSLFFSFLSLSFGLFSLPLVAMKIVSITLIFVLPF